ncbi:MAG TPA: ABC transporter permease [Methanocorpusculum sp.]|nr:ABC transporter permease [Methanocorpusculum sp.]
MNKAISRKIIRYSVSLLIVVLLVFFLPRCMPGDPVQCLVGEDVYVTQEILDSITVKLGLDQPLSEQFMIYIGNLLTGDLGYSYTRHQHVAALILDRLPWTLLLTGVSMLIGYTFGIIAGTWSGWVTEKKGAKILTAFGVVVSCIPPYLLGLIFFSVFVFQLGWFPYKGFYETPDIFSVAYHMALPILTLALFVFVRNLIIMRGSVLTEKTQLYPQFAKSLGIPQKKIIYGHVMKNAILPIVTHFAIDFGFILSGALFIEIVFSLNGLGRVMYTAILNLDYPVLSGLFLVVAFMAVFANMIADILYGVIDPRVKQGDDQ